MRQRPVTTRAEPHHGRGARPRRQARRPGGRPTREDAARLGDLILDIATERFLAAGYGATSIEEIARQARISKRTFYHRYPDKAALFGAVIQRVVEHLRPPDAAALLAAEGPPEEVLLHLAHAILRAALRPEALALHRLIVAEAGRFPELAAAVAEQGATRTAVVQIAALLARQPGAPDASVREFAAAQFLQMVTAVPLRRALGLGTPMSPADIEGWARDTVRLFLTGYRGFSRST